jgi:ABC-2 type transport system permease protein
MQNITSSSGLQLFLRSAVARGYPRIWGAHREPSWVIFEIIVPIINMAAFVFLYRALGAPEQYVGFLILGTAVATYWLNVLWMMASQLYWDKQGGFLELYIMSPASLMAVLLGMGVGGVYMSTLRAGSIAVLGTLLFGVSINLTQWASALLVFLVTMVALYGLGMLLSSIFLMWGREAWQISLALHEPVFLLTGVNFPLRDLFRSIPGWFSLFAGLVPMGLGLDALRQLLFPGEIVGLLPVAWELGIMVGIGIVFILAAYLMIKRMEWLARVEARLSLRWQ